MSKDNESEDVDLSQDNNGDQTVDKAETQDQQDNDQKSDDPKDDANQEESQEDFRGKLNATNRFLQKEGYVFQDGKWQKKAGESGQKEESKDKPAAKPALSREEGILIAKGFSEEEVEYAQKVAELQKKPLTEAVTDDLFTAWKAKRDKDAKDKAAQLGTSRGGRSTVKKSFRTPGLSDDEHKEMFNERAGR
jgi:hypothetical protein